MKAIAPFNVEGLFSYDSLVNLCEGHIRSAKQDKDYLHRFQSPRWFLAELYCTFKKNNEIPDLSLERKKEIWKEAKSDKMLAFSLYLIEII